MNETPSEPVHPRIGSTGEARELLWESTAWRSLWEQYFAKMVRVARARLPAVRRVARDEEDIALSAFHSFCCGLRIGKYRTDGTPENLWPLMLSITLNKVNDHLRHEGRIKRGGQMERVDLSSDEIDSLIYTLTSKPASPEQLVAFQDALDNLLRQLDSTNDPTLCQIAIASMEGGTPQEIANQLRCSVRTIQRKLRTIQAIWRRCNP